MLTSLLTQFGALGKDCAYPAFFGLKPWYYYLETDKACNVINFRVLYRDSAGKGNSDFLPVALVIVDDLLRIAGFVAIGYIIYGGILYVTSQGSPDQTGKAQNTILNALIGLVISIAAVAFVSFVGSRIG